MWIRNRQRIERGFLLLACAIVALCLVQQGSLLRTLRPLPLSPFSQTLSDFQTTHASNQEHSAAPTPCSLSAHSLLIAQPLFFDCPLPALGMLLAMFALLMNPPCVFPPVRAASSPVLRIHLKLCVFRE